MAGGQKDAMKEPLMGRMPELEPCSRFQRGLPSGVPMGQPQGSLLFHLPSSSLPCSGSPLPPPWAMLCPGLGHLVLWGEAHPRQAHGVGPSRLTMPSCGAERPALHQVKKGKKEGLRGPSLSPGPSYKAAQVTDTPPGAVRCTHPCT